MLSLPAVIVFAASLGAASLKTAMEDPRSQGIHEDASQVSSGVASWFKHTLTDNDIEELIATRGVFLRFFDCGSLEFSDLSPTWETVVSSIHWLGPDRRSNGEPTEDNDTCALLLDGENIVRYAANDDLQAPTDWEVRQKSRLDAASLEQVWQDCALNPGGFLQHWRDCEKTMFERACEYGFCDDADAAMLFESSRWSRAWFEARGMALPVGVNGPRYGGRVLESQEDVLKSVHDDWDGKTSWQEAVLSITPKNIIGVATGTKNLPKMRGVLNAFADRVGLPPEDFRVLHYIEGRRSFELVNPAVVARRGGS